MTSYGEDYYAAQTAKDSKKTDSINERIQELRENLPDWIFEVDSKKNGAGTSHGPKFTGTKNGKPNKGQILSKSVEYIEYLQDKVDENNKKEIELLIILKTLEDLKKIPNHAKYSTTLFKNTSAEIELSNIGVGPLAENEDNEIQENETNQELAPPMSNINGSNTTSTDLSVGMTNNSSNTYYGSAVPTNLQSPKDSPLLQNPISDFDINEFVNSMTPKDSNNNNNNSTNNDDNFINTNENANSELMKNYDFDTFIKNEDLNFNFN